MVCHRRSEACLAHGISWTVGTLRKIFAGEPVLFRLRPRQRYPRISPSIPARRVLSIQGLSCSNTKISGFHTIDKI